MILNGIHLFDEPNKLLMPPEIQREVKNYIDIIKTKKISVHNHADFIGYTSDYNKIDIDGETCGGFCNWITKELALSKYSSHPIKTICHELGHTIQDRLGLFNLKETFSYQVVLEHQAETIAYNLYSALIDKNISHKKFNSYFNLDDITWLNKYYNGYFQNDLLI